jgi:hypothetical protein
LVKRKKIIIPAPWLTLARQKKWRFGLQLLLVLAIAGILYRQLLQPQSLQAILKSFQQHWQTPEFYWLVIAGFLMPFNWLLETLKWRQFTRSWSTMSLLDSLYAVLAGVAASMLLPNRSGDYLGRLLLSPSGEKAKAAVATLAGSYCQWVVLGSVGIPSLLWFAPRYIGWDFRQGGPILMLELLALLGLIILGAFIPKWIQHFFADQLQNDKFRWLRPLEVILAYRPGVLARGLGLATTRYLLYCFQYYCMLRFYGIFLPLGTALAGVGVIYLLQTSIPLPPVLGLLARGEIALMVWRPFGANALSVLAASYSLFTLNLLAPALVGLLLIVKNAYKKTTHVDEKSDSFDPVFNDDRVDGV